MGESLTHKVLRSHLVSGSLDRVGEEIGIMPDQVLAQDATGTMACMQFEQIGLPRIKPRFAVLYIDHNTLQLDYKNPDDHRFLRTFCQKYGIHYSRPGNGICHYVHMQRFAVPGETLVGSDSHTTMAGCMGMIAMGSGGLDIAVALAGHPYEFAMPKVVSVRLEGDFAPWTTPKDIILELLRRLTVTGGYGRVFEFTGPSVAKVPLTGRGTICNMIAELGATAGIFPSDEETRRFLKDQEREQDWKALAADPDARYDEEVVINLSELEPLIAVPHNPDKVVPVREVAGKEVAQVCLGSSVNSSYEDMALAAAILKGKTIPGQLQLTVSPGSRQIMMTMLETGIYRDLVSAGARMLEPMCGPCVGIGYAPPSNAISVRTMNRNFPGRSGTNDDQVYLTSPPVAAATALMGVITDPRTLGSEPKVQRAPKARIDDSQVLKPLPPEEAAKVQVIRGPNIKEVPKQTPLPDVIQGRVLIKLGDNISTGSMAPDGVEVMSLRSNVPAIAEYTFRKEDPEFPTRARAWGGGYIVGGKNYGQGSSREHAAMAPKHLGVRAVFAKSIARIHRRNLIAQGMLPLYLDDEIHARAKVGDSWTIRRLRDQLHRPDGKIEVDMGSGTFDARHDLSPREVDVLLAGGLLAHLTGQQAPRPVSP